LFQRLTYGVNRASCAWGKLLTLALMTLDHPISAPAVRPLWQGREWRVSEYLCTAGPGDRPFEERHEQVSIAAVIAGTFTYRADTGSTMLHPGAFLLGNAATCYECGHEHSRGDRCISFQAKPEYFAEVAASMADSSRFRFPAPMLPATPKLLPWLARIQARADSVEPLDIDETAARLVEAVIGAVSGRASLPVRVSSRDRRRIGEALRYIEINAAEPLDLDTLAGVAIMSKYHFLRTFRHTVGVTPYQFVLGVRMRHAAVWLATSSAPVFAIAFETGFGDLSTFNARFRETFGMSPTAFRSQERIHGSTEPRLKRNGLGSHPQDEV
jgi:AraC family transcriptional regulator